MEYTIKKIADLAGVSTRTLRYYDQIGLLRPAKTTEAGYRVYEKAQVDRLQQILFYRAFDVPLSQIKAMMDAPSFDRERVLKSHLDALYQKRDEIEALISNMQQTISYVKGEKEMSNHNKFYGLKRRMTEVNEAKYGAEIREKYGDETIDASNAKFMGMSEEKMKDWNTLSEKLNETLKKACEQRDPASALAQKACALHQRWLGFTWGTVAKDAHLGLVQMYVDDPRFSKYYEKIAEGSALFLRDAMQIFYHTPPQADGVSLPI